SYVETLKEIILDENFTVVKFYKRINFSFIQKRMLIQGTRDHFLGKKLLVNFKELINTTMVNSYWNGQSHWHWYNSGFELYNGESSSSDPDIIPRSLTNVFIELKNPDSGDRNSNKGDILKSTNNDDGIISEYDLAQESLSGVPLKGNKWLWNGIDICNSFRNSKNAKTPLNIGVVNFHTNLCIEFLPSSMITNIQEQIENDDINTITFDDGKKFG
ncbi:6364_t:CDS:2, partial [Gigaspora margarita]